MTAHHCRCPNCRLLRAHLLGWKRPLHVALVDDNARINVKRAMRYVDKIASAGETFGRTIQ